MTGCLGNGVWGRCGGWDAYIGGLGYAPGGFHEVLRGLGMGRGPAKALVGRMEATLRTATKELWMVRNEAHMIHPAPAPHRRPSPPLGAPVTSLSKLS